VSEQVSASVLDLVGNTPMVRLRGVTAGLPERVEVYAKLEYFNPGGSVKDRAARQMILEALADGRLSTDKVLIDSTSGNTGVAYAMFCAALGIEAHLVMPSNVSQPRKELIAAYGAKIIFSDPLEGSDGAIELAHQVLAEDRTGRYFYPDQYSNPANPRAHELTTGPEIVRDTEGRVTHFVAGLGTTGTVMGTGRALRRLAPAARIVAVQPDAAFHGLEGLKHLESSIVPAIYEAAGHDETVWMGTEAGWAMRERLGREEGLVVGHSSGASVEAALRVAQGLTEGVIVCICCDHGDRYFDPRKLPRSSAAVAHV
jgi:cysteine synthase B